MQKDKNGFFFLKINKFAALRTMFFKKRVIIVTKIWTRVAILARVIVITFPTIIHFVTVVQN